MTEEIRVFVPSYRRSGRLAATQRYLPFATLVVAEAEAAAYQASGNRILVCPDAVQGNLCRVRNWILEQHKDARGVVLLDDDYEYIARWRGRDAQRLSADDVEEFLEHGFTVAEDLGAFLWGINLTNDKGAYREYTPLSTVAYIGGPFQAHRPNVLRYDEALPLKEDYDLSLQHLHRYRRTLRFNAYFYQVRQNEQAGGCATYRTIEREREQFRALQRKWGSGIVREDDGADKRMVRGSTTVKGWDLNPRLAMPIPGV